MGKKRFFQIRMDSGLMVLSNKPLEERDLFEFPDLNGYDGYSRKCVCTALVDGVLIAGTQVQVDENEAACACRKKNIANIKEHISQVAQKLKVDRIVFAGNLNMDEQHADDYKYVTDEFTAITPPLRDALRILHPSVTDEPGITVNYDENANTKRWGKSSGRLRYDYFFVSEKITVKQQETLTTWKIVDPADGKDPLEKEDVSDHYAISLVFE